MNSYYCRSRIASFLGLDYPSCPYHLLRILNRDVLLWLDALLFGTFSRYRSGGSLSVRNELRSIISKKTNLTLMDKWRIVRIYPKYLQRHCLQLQSGNLFIPEMCRHLRIRSSWLYTTNNFLYYVHVFILFWEFLCSHEKHMLQVMC